MNDNKIIEVMARAIYNELYKDSAVELTDDNWRDLRGNFICEAKAALSALRGAGYEVEKVG